MPFMNFVFEIFRLSGLHQNHEIVSYEYGNDKTFVAVDIFVVVIGI